MQPTKATRAFLLTVLCGSIIAVAPSSAQQTSTSFTESIDVDLINVEVVVTDKQGEPITDLTRDDFEIFEDGQAMEVTNFYVAKGHAVENPQASPNASQPPPVAATLTPAAPDAEAPRPAGVTPRLNLILFVDNVNIQPTNRKLLFENLRQELRDGALVDSRVMLVAMNRRIEVMEPFTDDIERVFAALEVMEKQSSIHALVDSQHRLFLSRLARSDIQDFPCSQPNRPPPPPPSGTGTATGPGTGGGSRLGGSGSSAFRAALRDAEDLASDVIRLGEQRYQTARSTVQALQFFTDTLGGLPGRKALIYLSDGIPMRPAESLSEAWIAKYALWIQQHADCIDSFSGSALSRATTGSGVRQFNLRGDLSRLRERASDNKVTFYPISNHGRGGTLISAEVPGSTDGASGTMIRSAMIAEAQDRTATLLQMAEDTGGQALTGNANIGELIRRLNQDFSSFYSLGYTAPTVTGEDGKRKGGKRDNTYHKIEVKVRREGAKVRHVAGRRDKSWVDRLGDMTAAAALFGLEANPLGIQLQRGEPVPDGKRFKVPILVQIPFNQIEMLNHGESYSADLTLLVVVRDDKGGFSQPRRIDLPVEIPQAQIEQARQQSAAYPLELNMKKNAQVVAVGVRDNIAQTASSVTLDYDFGGGDDDTSSDDGTQETKKKKKKKKKPGKG